MPTYRPTGPGTPTPTLLNSLSGYAGRWVPVTEALPPESIPVLVIVRGDNCPAFAWLDFAAGDESCPYFICPQTAAIGPRGIGRPSSEADRTDVTYWFAPTEHGLPFAPQGYAESKWGLDATGWKLR